MAIIIESYEDFLQVATPSTGQYAIGVDLDGVLKYKSPSGVIVIPGGTGSNILGTPSRAVYFGPNGDAIGTEHLIIGPTSSYFYYQNAGITNVISIGESNITGITGIGLASSGPNGNSFISCGYDGDNYGSYISFESDSSLSSVYAGSGSTIMYTAATSSFLLYVNCNTENIGWGAFDNNFFLPLTHSTTSGQFLADDGSGNLYWSSDISSATVSVYSGLTAQGVDITTTSVMNYGVNVFTGVTPSNFCTKLPQPVTGKSVKVVNMATQSLLVFPSNAGGQINNLPINSPAIIPADGAPHEFICIENPLPGAWTWNAPATNQILIAEMEVPHTNGIATNAYGCGITVSITAGIGVTSSGNMIISSGQWASENSDVTVTKVKCYTNIVDADVFSAILDDAIITSLITGFKNGTASVTSGQRTSSYFLKAPSFTGGLAPIGTLNSPPEVGDTDTMYDFQTPDPQDGIYDQIGINGNYSRYFYIMGMFIPASAATKNYKFQFFLEYY